MLLAERRGGRRLAMGVPAAAAEEEGAEVG
jgi:hypothetical protein